MFLGHVRLLATVLTLISGAHVTHFPLSMWLASVFTITRIRSSSAAVAVAATATRVRKDRGYGHRYADGGSTTERSMEKESKEGGAHPGQEGLRNRIRAASVLSLCVFLSAPSPTSLLDSVVDTQGPCSSSLRYCDGAHTCAARKVTKRCVCLCVWGEAGRRKGRRHPRPSCTHPMDVLFALAHLVVFEPLSSLLAYVYIF